jgi:hypothetical protein
LLYLAAPIALVLWGISVLVREDDVRLVDLITSPIWMLVFYPGPHLWWVGLCKLKALRPRYWHAGLIASSLAFGACMAMPYFGEGDHSGLPYHWFLYWPLAVVLQVILAASVRVAGGAYDARRPNTSFERTREG